jgi:D-glycero-alpha-D-manno-heptose-7-phosphate kinase
MIVVRAPFRLPIGGGGTDLPSYYSKFGGSLITAAINKYMYISINRPAVSDVIKVKYNQTEIVKPHELHLIKHDILRETLKYFNIDFPLEISSMADLSGGTGMGSSSSYTVALLSGLNTLTRKHMSLQELAEEACKVEISLCGKPIGKQDQYAATYGGMIQMTIDKDGKVVAEDIKLESEVIHELESRLMMFYTSIERDANVILGEQSKKIEQPNASDKAELALQSMHNIKQIGFEIKDCLLKGDVTGVGRLMNEHWQTKKRVSDKMSNSNIDSWYDLAMKNGALGGKIMGAGGGGFFVFVVEPDKRKQVRTALEGSGLKYMDYKFDFEGVKVLANV